MTDSSVPEGCAPAEYALAREYFVANYLDGDDGGQVTVPASILADTVAELFSNGDWYQVRNAALIAHLREVAGLNGDGS